MHEVCAATGNRLAMLEAIMADRRKERASAGKIDAVMDAQTEPGRHREWSVNEERNSVIRNLRARGKTGLEICEGLDKRTIDTPPALQQSNIHRWVEGWENPKLRRNIQAVFSKQGKRAKAVKP